jgi:hypothetical protein
MGIKSNIIEAEDGLETIYFVYKAMKMGCKISLIFSDENMNFLCGIKSAEIIKDIISKHKLTEIPFYTVSAYGLETFDPKCLKYVEKILSKPIQPKVAREIMSKHFQINEK